MTVSEPLQGVGRWEIELADDTPDSVFSALDVDTERLSHIVITAGQLDPDALGDAAMLSAALYTGVFRERPTGTSIAGTGLAYWIGDHDSLGAVLEQTRDGLNANVPGGADQSFDAWVHDILSFPEQAIVAGSVSSTVSGTFDETLKLLSAREMLDIVCREFDASWRINPDGTLDAGDDLYVDPPEVIVGPGLSGREADGLVGLAGVAIDADRDVSDYTTRVVLVGQGEGAGTVIGTAETTSPPYNNIHGRPAHVVRVVDAAEVGSAAADSLAAAQLGRFKDPRVSYTVSSEEPHIRRHVEPGDEVWVYDPSSSVKVVDTSNEVYFQGRALHPKKVQLERIVWPVEEDLGVYLRRQSDASYLDLTPHVIQETQPATLDVGASPRRLTDPTAPTRAIQARLNR